MDTAGLVMILIGIYLLTSAIKNRRPIELAKRIIASPGSAKTLTQTAEGYEPVETGSPRFIVGGSANNAPPETGETSPNPTMALSKTPSYADGSSRPGNVSGGVAAGVKPVARAGL